MNRGHIASADASLRPGFAEELLLRLARDARPDRRRHAAAVAAGALGGATVAVLLAGRRMGRR